MPISCVLKCVDDVVLNPDFNPFSFERLVLMPENPSIFKEKLKERNTLKDLDKSGSQYVHLYYETCVRVHEQKSKGNKAVPETNMV